MTGMGCAWMRQLMACALLAVVGALPWTAALARGQAGGVPVLIYHEIVNDGRPGGETVIGLQAFEAQMQYLADHGYQPVSMDQLVAYMRWGEPLPQRPVVLTFDDGWRNVLNAVPVLTRLGFKASFWVIAGPRGIGGDYMDWSDIEALGRHPGFEVHSHSASHPWNPKDNLVTWVSGQPSGRGHADVMAELAGSRQELMVRLKKPMPYLAWPCGWYNDALIELGRRVGYTAFLTAEQGLNHPGGDALRIKRSFIDGSCGMREFEQTLSDGRYRVCQTTRSTTQGHTPPGALLP